MLIILGTFSVVFVAYIAVQICSINRYEDKGE